MKKYTTHLTLIAVLAVSAFTFSFAHWRAQAAGGSGIWAGLSVGLPGRKAARAERHVAAAVAPVKVAPAAPMFATITVNSTADGTLAALAGNGTCELREAIEAANTNAAVDSCAAGVAGADVIEFALGAGTPTINVLSDLPTITDPVTINGNTGGSTRVELNGASAGASVNGLLITAGGSTIEGLVINRFSANGIVLRDNGGNTIKNCYIGTNAAGTTDLGNRVDGVVIDGVPNNTVGGTMAGTRNLISGNNGFGVSILFAGATGNKVIGNYIGADVNGTADLGNTLHGVYIDSAPSNTVGGATAGERNLISGNDQSGVGILGTGAVGNKVIGNYIGTDVNGTADLGNAEDGVRLNTTVNNMVGGATAGARNLISGNDQFGVNIFNAGATGNKVIGNYIGTDVNGTADLGNTLHGVYIDSASDNTVGGATAGERNLISGNDQSGVGMLGAMGNKVIGNYIGTDVNGTADLGNKFDGVRLNTTVNITVGGTTAGERNLISGNDRHGLSIVNAGATGNTILGNAIFNNTNLGIDLGDNGVTANDTGDADTGANNLQNFPVLTCATSAGDVIFIAGMLNSLPTTRFRIEYFVNNACDASGNGEGQTFLGSHNFTTDGSGNTTFSTNFLATVAAGQFITATVTRLDALNNPIETSEFSACLAVNSSTPTLAISDATLVEGNAGTTNMVFTVTLTGAQTNCLSVIVDYATANGTATAGSDYTATSGTLTFNSPHASNSLTKTITVPVTGDTTAEPNETFFVNLTNPFNATISDNQGLGTITNDDNPATTPLTVRASDPAVCLDANGLVGVQVTVTNPNNSAQISSWNVTLPAGLTALAGSCAADVNPGGCVVAANGGSLAWNGTLAANQTVNLIYRARLGANVTPGAQFCLDNQATVGGVPFNVNYCFNAVCPTITNTRVSDQKPGSVLVFPYYTSTIGGDSDTRLTISNLSNVASTLANQTYVHLFFIDGTTCQQADLFLCLTPNASFSFKASEYDPGNTGYVLAVAVDKQGVPIQSNVLSGNAFVRTPTLSDNYGAESFWANSFSVALVTGNTATLFFDQVGYDAVPKQFAVEVQSPLEAAGQQVITAGLSGDLTTSAVSGAAQVGTAQAFNEKEVFASFQGWLLGTCQARGTITMASPRVPNGLGNLIKTGQAGSLKFNVGGAVGLLLTPRGGAWTGIRTLHKTQTTTTSLTIPVLVPVC